MNNDKKIEQDNAMASLLLLGHSFRLGPPSWVLTELVTRTTYPQTPRHVLGLTKRGYDQGIVSEYVDKKGYEFSWGTVSEDIEMYDDEQEDIPIAWFEIFPTNLLKTFPNSALVEDLFLWLYNKHPLCNKEFEGEEAVGDWFVLSFSAEGVRAIDRLRLWLAATFVPRIMPDLLAEATRIINEAKTASVDEAGRVLYDPLVEGLRFQLCPE